jgi:hypothetical protein
MVYVTRHAGTQFKPGKRKRKKAPIVYILIPDSQWISSPFPAASSAAPPVH